MDLILWRHAEAEPAPDGADDMSRALTAKGERQAARMAVWLDRHLPDGTRVLVSPARRAEQTALALGRKYKLRDELLPGSSAAAVLELLKWHPDSGPKVKGTVLLVGHQPYLGHIVALLLGMHDESCAFGKGAVWWLRTRVRQEQLQTVLLAVSGPELISRSWGARS